MESIICTLFPIASRLQWRLCWRRQLSGWDFTKGSNWNKSSKIIAWVLSFCSLRFIALQLGFYNFITSAMCSFFNTYLTWWNKYEKICLCIYQLFAFIIWVFFFKIKKEFLFVTEIKIKAYYVIFSLSLNTCTLSERLRNKRCKTL